MQAIPSKSAAHRLLIAAAMSGQDLEGRCDGLSLDISATKKCLQAILHHDATLPCGESGSTLRFLIPLAAVLGISADFLCEGRLPDRPMEPLLKVLGEHGCTVTGHNPKHLEGKLTGGDFHLPGNVSSQYVTGLLMALPLAEEDSRIIVEGRLQSRPYIDMTLEVLAKAGITVREQRQDASSQEEERAIFDVPGRQRYRLPEEELEHIEGDWSNGAFWIVMDAMLRGGDPVPVIRCQGLDPASAQGDRGILEVLARLNDAGEDAAEVDVSQIPDLVPAIAAFACGRAKGAVSRITGAERLRFKESDRLKAVTEVLSGLGADITEEENGLLIRGSVKLRGGDVPSFGDHRIVMMAASAACLAEKDIVIRGAQAVEKSYPGFFADYEALGGSVEVL